MKISGIGFAIVLIAFLMPFLVVKCADTKIVSLTGLKIATGGEVRSPVMESMTQAADELSETFETEDTEGAEAKEKEEAEGSKLKINIFALIGLLAAIGGLIAALVVGRDRFIVPLAIAIVGVIALLLIKVGMQGSMDMDDSGEYSAMIKIEYQFGYFLAWLGFIIAGVVAYLAGTGKGPFGKKDFAFAPGGMGIPAAPTYEPPSVEPVMDTPPVEDLIPEEAPPAVEEATEAVAETAEEETEENK